MTEIKVETRRTVPGVQDPKKHGQHKSIEDCLQCAQCRPIMRLGARQLFLGKHIDEATCTMLENETDSKGMGYSFGNRAERRRVALGKRLR